MDLFTICFIKALDKNYRGGFKCCFWGFGDLIFGPKFSEITATRGPLVFVSNIEFIPSGL